MTEEQAKKIIELLEAINLKLSDVIDGDASVEVHVNGPVTVETDYEHPLATYEPRS